MKSKLLVLFMVAICLLSMTACDFVGIDFGGVSLSIGTTPTEIVYPTITAYPTSTPYPTYTPQPTYTALPTLTEVPTFVLPVATETIVYKSITWKELTVFLIQDLTNQNTYNASTGYMCVEFSTDLVNNLHAAGYDAWIVAITWLNDEIEGHAFVAVPTSDLGIVYIDPQADIRYIPPKIGDPLCEMDDASACFSVGGVVYNIGTILDPAICDVTTNTCSGIMR